MPSRSLAVLMLIAAPALAGSAPEGEPIPPEEWRALTAGRTVWYSLNGRHWGKEHFDAERDRATFLGADGACVTAPWMYADGVYCFAYGGMHCFRHLRRGETIVVVPLGDGAEQTVEKIDRTPLSCEPPLSS
jgi:hypothetical protein